MVLLPSLVYLNVIVLFPCNKLVSQYVHPTSPDTCTTSTPFTVTVKKSKFVSLLTLYQKSIFLLYPSVVILLYVNVVDDVALSPISWFVYECEPLYAADEVIIQFPEYENTVFIPSS